MSDLTLQLLEWIAARPRTRADVLEAWSSSCPRLTIWEDAITDGLVRFEKGVVRLTDAGRKRCSDAAPAGATDVRR
jgi:hypothetical protein